MNEQSRSIGQVPDNGVERVCMQAAVEAIGSGVEGAQRALAQEVKDSAAEEWHGRRHRIACIAFTALLLCKTTIWILISISGLLIAAIFGTVITISSLIMIFVYFNLCCSSSTLQSVKLVRLQRQFGCILEDLR
jgi:L-asparagine transporter-like permease